MDSLSQTAGFISGCVGSRRRSPDEIQLDTNIAPVDKAVENPVDKVWGTGANPVGNSGAEACHRLAGFCRNPESQQTLQAGVFRVAIS
jgi:hypothetical protein